MATLAADELTPNCAPLVAHDLGATKAGAMDVSAACTGFLSALALATAQVEGGRADNVLVIGADVLSRFIDKTDRGTAALFADGAGAAVVTRRRRRPRPHRPHRPALRRRRREVDRGHARGAAHPHAGPRHLQGGGPRGCPRPRSRPSQLAGLALDDIGLFVYHQANARILAAVGERLGLDDERVINSIDRYGNTSAATLPIALADARERGMVEPGMNVLLAAFGAGFTWGAGVIEWAA